MTAATDNKRVGVIQPEAGAPLSVAEEIAYICWNELSADVRKWIDIQKIKAHSLKKKAFSVWITAVVVSGMIGAAAYYYGSVEGVENVLIGGGAIAGVFLLVMFAVGVSKINQSGAVLKEKFETPLSSIELLKRSLTVVPLDKRCLVVDQDKLSPNLSIEYKEIDQSLSTQLGKLSCALDAPPVISGPSRSQDLPKGVEGEYEEQLLDEIAALRKLIDSCETVKIDLSVAPASDGLTQLLMEKEMPEDWINSGQSDSEQVKRLLEIKEQDVLAKRNGSASVEESISNAVQQCKTKLASVNEIRKYSLIEHLGRSVRAVENSSSLSVLRIVCQSCLKKSSKVTGSIFADVHGVLQSSIMQYSGVKGGLVCQQCGEMMKLDNHDTKAFHRATEELLFPLWDRLWGELDTEKNSILRDKETQLRDLRAQERDQLLTAHKQFDAECRSRREKLDDLVEKGIKAKGSLLGMLRALSSMGLSTPESEKKYTELVTNKDREVRKDIELAQKLMKDFEQGVNNLNTKSHGDHFVLMDEVEAVKNAHCLIKG